MGKLKVGQDAHSLVHQKEINDGQLYRKSRKGHIVSFMLLKEFTNYLKATGSSLSKRVTQSH